MYFLRWCVHLFRSSSFLLLFAATLSAQGVLTCVGSSTTPIIRAEGLSEKTGDVVLSCSGGQPNSTITGNLTLFANTNVTNRQLPDGSVDVQLTVNGAPVSPTARLGAPNSITFFNLGLPTTAQGTVELRIANVRVSANFLVGATSNVVQLYLSFSGPAAIAISNPLYAVGIVQTALFAGSSGTLVCSQTGAPLPSPISFSTLATASPHASNRLTEGFGSALTPKSDTSNQLADTGIRVIARYSGFPAGARLFVPDAVTGSTATRPTSAGDFGVSASGGAYTPGRGELLMIRVNGASSDGSGGTLALPTPAAATTFNSVGELAFSNGSAFAVYEVVDANPAIVENAQIPAFLGLASGGAAATTTSALALGATSSVSTSSATAPIPRFVAVTPPADCTTVGDCNAAYYPHLTVIVNSSGGDLQLTPSVGVGYVVIQNSGGGVLSWTASTTASFLRISPAQGTDNGGFRVDAVLTGLAPGTYHGTVVVDAGPIAGSKTINVTLTVPEASAVLPVIQSVGNAADPTITALVPGSLASIFGTRLTNPASVTFNDLPAKILYSGDTQLNVVVPAALTGSSAVLRVSAAGATSTGYTVTVAASAPAIFVPGILNQDWHVNAEATPAPAGSTIMIYATGLPATGAIKAKIHDRMIDLPAYAGPAPGIDGVQQVNATIPGDLPAMQTWAYVCVGDTCSAPVKLWISR